MATIDYLAAIELDGDGHIGWQVTALFDMDGDVKRQVESIANEADASGMRNYFIAHMHSDTHGDEKHEDGKDVYRAHSTVNVLYEKKRGGKR